MGEDREYDYFHIECKQFGVLHRPLIVYSPVILYNQRENAPSGNRWGIIEE
jgi:hypothetical protein